MSEHRLAAENYFPGALVADPDRGGIWFLNVRGIPWRGPSTSSLDRFVSRGQAEPVAELPTFYGQALARGPDGDLWTLSPNGVIRASPTGEVTSFPRALPRPGRIAAGPEGNMWFTESNGSFGPDRIVRIAPSGAFTEFPLPAWEAGPGDIVAGPDGNLWFTETSKIGRLSPAGELTEFPRGPSNLSPRWIAAGPDGNLWFSSLRAIGRITPAGRITTFAVPRGHYAESIAAGVDGRLWFVDQPGKLGSITPNGRFNFVDLPNAESYPRYVAPGPEGAIWYTGYGQRPCEGGGGTCMVWLPKRPGVVGRVVVGPLAVGIGARRALVSHRWARLTLSCEGGHARRSCRGRIGLSLRARRSGGRSGKRTAQRRIGLGGARYRLAADERRAVAIRLTGRALALVRRHGRLRAVASARAVRARGATRRIVLRRKAAAPRAR